MRKKIILILISLLTIITLRTFIAKFQQLEYQNGNNYNLTEAKELDKSDKRFSSFKGLKMKKENVRLNFEMKPLNLKLPIYNDTNRLYVPVSEICYLLDIPIELAKDTAILNINPKSVKINFKKNTFYKENNEFYLKKIALKSDDIFYLSLFDFTKLLNLKTSWNIETKTISLFYNTDVFSQKAATKKDKSSFIRLEDITAGQRYATSESLEKLRILADYLYYEKIPFHVAWIPRYINPSKAIDNDPSIQFNLYNADFIFTLDYFIDRNGLIGLHGYTHQQGDEESIDGIEFNSKLNNSEKALRKRVELAINSAKKLDIPIYFFESPHYDATISQKEIIGEYFDYMYEPYKEQNEKTIARVDIQNKTVKFIPTPLDYVDGVKDINNMITKICKLPEKSLASFFYHPNIEFEYINITKSKTGYPTYTYSEESPLHQLLKVFSDKNYEFKSIKDIAIL